MMLSSPGQLDGFFFFNNCFISCNIFPSSTVKAEFWTRCATRVDKRQWIINVLIFSFKAEHI